MKYNLRKATLISYIVACIMGVLLHFAYDWSGKNFLLGLFVPVNESTWEHLKLVFFPILIMSLVEYYYFNVQHEDFICVKFRSALIGMLATVVLFYTYKGVLGRNIDFINITVYFIAMTIAYCYSYKKLKKESTGTNNANRCFLGFCIFILLFAYLTIFPPNIGLFAPPA